MRKQTTKRKGSAVLTGCLFMAVFCVFLGVPGIAAATTPVRILGTIVPMQQENRADDYVLQYKGHQWGLKIDDVDVAFANAGGSETADGWSLLNQMGRQRIVVIGPEKEAVKALENPHDLCKGVMIQGTLYPSTGTLALASIEPAPAANLPAKCGWTRGPAGASVPRGAMSFSFPYTDAVLQPWRTWNESPLDFSAWDGPAFNIGECCQLKFSNRWAVENIHEPCNEIA